MAAKSFSIVLCGLLALGSSAACTQTVSTTPAAKCVVIEGGASERYIDVDELAMSVASEYALRFDGADTSARVIRREGRSGQIVLTAPFGEWTSIISLFEGSSANQELDRVFEEIAARLSDRDMLVRDCASVDGLKTPRVPSAILE